MSDGPKIKPFRWDLSRREQLGGLLHGDADFFDRRFLSQLRDTAAKVVALGADARLVFVGRSPETLFDYLSGVFHDVGDAPPLTLLQFSNRGWDAAKLQRVYPRELEALHGYFRLEALDPAAIAAADRPIRFVDLVSEGGTFTNLVSTLQHWSSQTGADWNAVKRRIGFIGLTWKKHTSPNTWRWQQHMDWTDAFRRDQIVNVSVPGDFWGAVGNSEDKVTLSHHVGRWADERSISPVRWEKNLKALRAAVQLFDLGRTRKERASFSKQLAEQPQMANRAVRGLVLKLRG